VSDFFIRRFKKDIAHEVAESFQERQLELDKKEASPAEDKVFDYVDAVVFKTIARERKSKGILFRTLLLKSFLSSPAACSSTIAHRLEHKDLQDESDVKVRHDGRVLGELKKLVDAVKPRQFQKLQALTTMGWDS